MILKDSMQYIISAIKIYNKLVNKTYLIGFGINKNQPLKFVELKICEQNFWHLVGCKIDSKKKLSKSDIHELYGKCLNEEDISRYLVYIHESIDVKIKSEVIEKVFDFIGNAKILRMAMTGNTPENYIFELGLGSGVVKGLVGYSAIKSVYIPKTAQMKSIYAIDPKANNKIEIILSKYTFYKQYDKIEFVANEILFAKELPQLLEKYKLSPKIIALIQKDILVNLKNGL